MPKFHIRRSNGKNISRKLSLENLECRQLLTATVGRPVGDAGIAIQHNLSDSPNQVSDDSELDWIVVLAKPHHHNSMESGDKYAPFLRRVESTIGREPDVKYRYERAIHGLSVRLTRLEAERIASIDSVVSIQQPAVFHTTSDSGPSWIGADDIWLGNSSGVASTRGEGIVVGILDSGIDFDNASFAEVGPVDGYIHENPRGNGNFLGLCDPNHETFDPQVSCNNKLVGMYDYTPRYAINSFLSDHGTHTASTAAGNQLTVNPIEFDRSLDFSISGVAPHANIIAYDVCTESTQEPGTNACPSDDVIAAIDQAILDDVDVINMSLGTDEQSSAATAATAALLAAHASGIFIAAAAGNDGPEPGTINTWANAPWVNSVANTSHDRSMYGLLRVNGPNESTELELPYLPGGNVVIDKTIGPLSIIDAKTIDEANDIGCAPFPANSFNGTIALINRGECRFVEKVQYAQEAGAIAVILANNVDTGLITMAGLADGAIPSVFVSKESGDLIREHVVDLLSSTTATIDAGLVVESVDEKADIVAGHSSRGPGDRFDVFTPNLAAPGTNVLAATTSAGEDQFDFMSGTSMASPHVAGAAALLISLHPDWTPQEIQSALMLTAWPAEQLFEDEQGTPADPFDVGAGRVNVNDAARVGFVLDVSVENFESMQSRPRSRELNLPAFMHSTLEGTFTWTRSLRSTQDVAVEWTPTSTGNDFLVQVEPAVVVLEPGETRDVTFRFDITAPPADSETWMFGGITMSPNEDLPVLHFPVAGKWRSNSVGLAIENPQMVEGEPTTARVFRTSATTEELVVELVASEEGQLEMPEQVVIAAGQTRSQPFLITAENDGLSEGDQQLTIMVNSNQTRDSVNLINVSDALPVGDLDGNGLLESHDLNLFCAALADGSDLRYDLTNDGQVDSSDRDFMVFEVLDSTYGDSNLDGIFNSTDLIEVFQAGAYEDDVSNNASWEQGDWNCDGDFDSSDLVLAFGSGNYSSASHGSLPTSAQTAAILLSNTEKMKRKR